jgi:heat shock protein HslJ
MNIVRLTALSALAALCACGPVSRPQAPEDLDGRWAVQEIAGASLGEGVDVWIEIDAANAIASGFTGCNAFTAPLTSFEQALTIGAPTEAAGECASQAAATDEARFLGVLPSVQRYILRGRSLELLPAASGAETLIKLRREHPPA